MTKKSFVYDHYLFTTRRGSHPNPWFWEIRRKSTPDGRSVSVGGFKSAKAAEEAGKIVLAQIREAVLEERRQNPPTERPPRGPRKVYQKKGPVSPERRSEYARIAAIARAKALSPERRKEIGQQGGAAWKKMSKLKRLSRSRSDS